MIAAGLIMVAVFGGFIFSESVIIRQLGFGLAVGVLLDAFVIRAFLIPALISLVGGLSWWPRAPRTKKIRRAGHAFVHSSG